MSKAYDNAKELDYINFDSSNNRINFGLNITTNNSTLAFSSAETYANAAFTQANAAFSSANNVAPQVQPAFSTANAAFIQANAAFNSANNVAPQVQPAFNTANAAFIQANSAYNTANNAGGVAALPNILMLAGM
jgi:hypothetical protein